MEKTKNLSLKGLKKELDSFMDETRKNSEDAKEDTNKILTLLEGQAGGKLKRAGEVSEEVDVSNFPEEIQLTSSIDDPYRGVFEKWFDENDGFRCKLGIDLKFWVYVPDKFSNMNSAQKVSVDKDERSIQLDAKDIEGGINKWCELVTKQLGYNKNIKTK